ncbi:MAG TPA: hypothetical protein VF590_27105 [Isosphaeraceae bacterium]|jgi:hypothetical protein
MARGVGNDQGKLEFVREMLQQDPNANEKTVNEAWQEAGNQGSISRSSVGKVRAEMGLTNKRRPRNRKAEEAPARKSATRPTQRRSEPAGAGQAAESPRARGNGAPAEAASSASANSGGDRGRLIEELEGDLDRLLFRVMSLGGLTEVEDLLRRSRRLLILGSQG